MPPDLGGQTADCVPSDVLPPYCLGPETGSAAGVLRAFGHARGSTGAGLSTPFPSLFTP